MLVKAISERDKGWNKLGGVDPQGMMWLAGEVNKCRRIIRKAQVMPVGCKPSP